MGPTAVKYRSAIGVGVKKLTNECVTFCTVPAGRCHPMRLPQFEEVEQRCETAGEQLRHGFEFRGVAAGHFQKVVSMKQGFEYWPGVREPCCIVRRIEGVTGAVLDDLCEPRVERAFRQQALQQSNGLESTGLDRVNLE